MKFGKLRTLRGSVVVNAGLSGKKALIVSDGLINHGLKILSFRVWKQDTVAGAYQFMATLSLEVTSGILVPNAADNRQIAWDSFSRSATVMIQPYNPIIDPNHIVNRDLELNLNSATAGTYNYLIEAQVVELSDDEAIITIIKETSQQ